MVTEKPKISVIDSPCGGGKSVTLHNYILNKILRERAGKRTKQYENFFQFVFVVPLLSEVERLENFFIENKIITKSRNITNTIFIPTGLNSPKSAESFAALNRGQSVIITHSLFLQNPKKFCDIISEREINLIIDETLAMFTYHSTHYQDLDLWISNGKVNWDKDSYLLSLNGLKEADYDHSSLKELFEKVENSSVYYYKGTVKNNEEIDEDEIDLIEEDICITKQKGTGTCVEMFPIEHFMKLPRVIISTYLFEGDPMKIYLDMCKLKYEYFYVEDKQKGTLQERYVLKKGIPESSGKDFKKLVDIYEPKPVLRGDPKVDYNKYWYYEDYSDQDKKKPKMTLSFSKSRSDFLSNEETKMIEESRMLYTINKEVKQKLFTEDEYDKIIANGKCKPIDYIHSLPVDKKFWDKNDPANLSITQFPAYHFMINNLMEEHKITDNTFKTRIENTAYFAKQILKYLNSFDPKPKPQDILWTSFKDQSYGFESEKNIVRGTLTRVKDKKHDPNFCQSSIRATNDFKDTSVLVFLINKFWNRFIYRAVTLINKDMPALDKKADTDDFRTVDNMYGLSVMIQWMFRSRIRKQVREPIQIYIPSKRMRKLLELWLEGYFDTKVLVEENEKRLLQIEEKKNKT